MIYGITGHQEREGIDWGWVRDTMTAELRCAARDIRGLTSLAKGADQVFAEAILEMGGRVTAIIPIEGYERYFDGDALRTYHRLLSVSDVVHMPACADDEACFLAAGLRVADDCDMLFAVWDGECAKGTGGTADIVAHARGIGRRTMHIQPITRVVTII